VITPVHVERARNARVTTSQSPIALMGTAAMPAMSRAEMICSPAMKGTFARPCAMPAHAKLVRFATLGAAVTAATAMSSSAGLMPGTPVNIFLTTMPSTPPSTAPSISGRKNHDISSRA
jgi:hypothetical protein